MNKKIGKNYIFLRKFCKKLYNLSENMAKIDALFTKSLTFLRFILNFPPPPIPESLKIYTHDKASGYSLELHFITDTQCDVRPISVCLLLVTDGQTDRKL